MLSQALKARDTQIEELSQGAALQGISLFSTPLLLSAALVLGTSVS